ncbi:MAG TPA: hypothetical protein VJJ73_01740 [Candidatus Paceibacterota bacterium]
MREQEPETQIGKESGIGIWNVSERMELLELQRQRIEQELKNLQGTYEYYTRRRDEGLMPETRENLDILVELKTSIADLTQGLAFINGEYTKLNTGIPN